MGVFYWDKMIAKIHKRLPEELNECSKCHLALPRNEFRRDKVKSNGLHSHCRICSRQTKEQTRGHDQELARARNKRWRDKHKYRRDINSKYGMSIRERQLLLIKQNHKCAICGIPEMEMMCRLSIDHCHKTGAVRGLLCKKCNLAIGNMMDNIGILQNAITYLENYNCNTD